jgi:hypothetical protein
MDVLDTSSKALDLYSEEVKRRIDQLEKTNKEKDETIKKKEETIKEHKERESVLQVMVVVLVAIIVGFFLLKGVAHLSP